MLPARGMLTLGLAELRDVPAGAQPLSQQQLEATLQVGWACFKSAWCLGATTAAVHLFTLLVRLTPVWLFGLSPASLKMLHGVGLGELVLAA